MAGCELEIKPKGCHSWLNERLIYYYPEKSSSGELKGYHENGAPFFKCPLVDGNMYGICLLWDELGNLKERALYFRGERVLLNEELYLASEQVTVQDIVVIENATVRQRFLEEFGYGRFLREMNGSLINEEGDQELVKIEWHKNEEPIYLVKVKCPTTGAFYALRVPPTMKTVKGAVAWTFGMKDKEYLPEQEA